MSNIISSDFYRVRKGAAYRNTCLGILAFIVIMLASFLFVQSGMATEMLTATNDLTPADVAELEQTMQAEVAIVESGAVFGFQVLSDFFIFMFFLPVVISVFCADFTAGTYRNTLSYESDRIKVYMAKLLLSIALCLAMVLGMLAVSFLLGSFAFGFSGFTAAFFGKLAATLLLQLPIYLATITVCHCIVSFAKKSSSTIAVFLAGYFALVLVLQLAVGIFHMPEWLMLLDAQSAGKMMAGYASAPKSYVVFVVAFNLGITALATLLGARYYQKTDMP